MGLVHQEKTVGIEISVMNGSADPVLDQNRFVTSPHEQYTGGFCLALILKQ
jgi:hypothetical protein